MDAWQVPLTHQQYVKEVESPVTIMFCFSAASVTRA
jgi:hypothetical protein